MAYHMATTYKKGGSYQCHGLFISFLIVSWFIPLYPLQTIVQQEVRYFLTVFRKVRKALCQSYQ